MSLQRRLISLRRPRKVQRRSLGADNSHAHVLILVYNQLARFDLNTFVRLRLLCRLLLFIVLGLSIGCINGDASTSVIACGLRISDFMSNEFRHVTLVRQACSILLPSILPCAFFAFLPAFFIAFSSAFFAAAS